MTQLPKGPECSTTILFGECPRLDSRPSRKSAQKRALLPEQSGVSQGSARKLIQVPKVLQVRIPFGELLNPA